MSAQHKRPIQILTACAAILVATIVAGAFLTASRLHESTLADNERELSNTALILAEHSDRALQAVELIHVSVRERMEALGIATREDFENRMSGQNMHEMLKQKIVGSPQIAVACLTSVDGNLVNFSRSWPSTNLNVAERDYIKALRSDDGLLSFVSKPLLNPVNGQWTLYFARKFFAPNGDFVGIVGVGIDLAYFEQLFRSVTLRQDGAIAMFRRDGVLLARHPHIGALIGNDFSHRPLFQHLIMRVDHGSMQINSQIDGKDRLASARKLNNYPIVIVVATTISTALSGWYQQTRLLIVLTSLSVCLISVIAYFLLQQWLRGQQRFRHELQAEKARLNTALNNMTQGLVLFDCSEQIVACNERYIEMYGLSSAVVKTGCDFRDLMRHRKEMGSFAGDIDQYRAELMGDLALEKSTETIIEIPGGRCIRILNKPLAGGGWIATHDDITERRRTDERIAYLAHYDALTELPNRVLFKEQLEEALKWTRRGQHLALLYLDLDHFKSVNDSLGHPVGDELLKTFAARLRGCLRETDTVARLGGDEFAIIQSRVGHPTDITNLVSRIQKAIRKPFDILGHQLIADTSIGIALAPDDGSEPDQLLKSADLALYGAKADGRGTFRFFEADMDARLKARRSLEFDLRHAIMCGDFEVRYQPVVRLRDNKVSMCEALLRWCHADRGMISPADFIPIAEETGLIDQLGEWVLRSACKEAATWPNDIKIAVNVSPVQFKSGHFVQMVTDALADLTLLAHRLELEITEAVLIGDDKVALAILQHLRELGVRIAMDDFGTGYSSLSYLQRFPFDKIKIDRSFIKGIGESESSHAIVQAIISIAKARNVTTTAEGVETHQQLEFLRALGCSEMQGYVFSPAIPAAEIVKLLKSSHGREANAA